VTCHGITGASAALWCSDIPFNGPIAGIRVGRVDGQLVANPTAKQREVSDMDIIMAVSREAIVMVEGWAEEVSEADMVAALEFGKQSALPALDLQDEMRRQLGKTERTFERAATVAEDLKAKVRTLAWDGIVRGYSIKEKAARYDALSKAKKEAISKLKEQLAEAYTPQVEKHAKQVVEDLKYEHMRELTVNGGRIGARGHAEVRTITCEVGVLPRTHGSALFTRGETQALVVATLGTAEDEQRAGAARWPVLQEVHAALQLPPVQRERDEAPARPGPS
jgi:polyribonucleotide nucleotidyltransferase